MLRTQGCLVDKRKMCFTASQTRGAKGENHMESPREWPYSRRSAWITTQERHVARYFAARNVPTRGSGYILANREAWELNLVDPRLKEWIYGIQEAKRAANIPFPIHEYVHHGLSSQALLINLLGPLILDQKWQAFDKILKGAKIPLAGKVTGIDLEHANRSVFNEDTGQPTSFDLACTTGAGEKVFIEFKFTEKGFGGCSLFDVGDCDGQNPADERHRDRCYLVHLGRTYWEKMDTHQLTSAVQTDGTCPLAYFYQAYRELLFALESGGKYVLIYDARNSAFVSNGPVQRGLWIRFLSSLPDSAKASVFSITIQEIADMLDEMGCSWIADLREKHDFHPSNLHAE